MTKYPLAKRLAARKAIALLTGSHASLGLSNRMSNFEGFRTGPSLDEMRRSVEVHRVRAPGITKEGEDEK